MIIIGEKINGAIPSVARAIAEKDADFIRNLAKVQSDAGADFIDVCASVETGLELKTLKWLIDLVQEVTDTPICIDSPHARSCAEAIQFCKRPGLINSVSGEGDKIDIIFPLIAGTECNASHCFVMTAASPKPPKNAWKYLTISSKVRRNIVSPRPACISILW